MELNIYVNELSFPFTQNAKLLKAKEDIEAEMKAYQLKVNHTVHFISVAME